MRNLAAGHKVLLLGFSVIQHKTLAELQSRHLPGILIDGFALGGHHFTNVPEYIDRALSRADYDLVVLDIVSSDCRAWATPTNFDAHLTTILHKIGVRGARAAFVHFWRPDVDAALDMLRHVCARYADAYGIPVLDFCDHMPASPELMDTYYKEMFHLTTAGAVWASDIMLDHLLAPQVWTAAQDLARITPDAALMRRCTLDADDLGVDARREAFARGGIQFDWTVHGEGEEVILHLPERFWGTGIYFGVGPQSGRVEVTIEGQEPLVLTLYGRKSYYERLRSFGLKIGRARQVRLRQLPGRPDVVLDKGEPDEGPRVLKWAWVAGGLAV